jgi:transcriptional regulator with XRE-family HTH domain
MLIQNCTGYRSVSFIDELQEPFGRKVKRLRKAKGWTQEYLAEQTHISARYLIDIEHGRYGPSFEVLHNLSQAFNIPVQDLFDFTEPEQPEQEKEDC